MNSLIQQHAYTGLTTEKQVNIKSDFYVNNVYAMSKEEFKAAIKVTEERGIDELSDIALMGFFGQCLKNLTSSYNVNMELYRESEKYYELSKKEILGRYNN